MKDTRSSKLPNHLKYQILFYKKDPTAGLCYKNFLLKRAEPVLTRA